MDYDDYLRFSSPQMRRYLRGPVPPYLQREKPGIRVGGRAAHRRPQVTDIAMLISGGGSGLIVGRYGDRTIPFNCRILQSVLVADAPGTITVDLRLAPYSAFPPVAANSIVGATPPSLSGDDQATDSNLVGWSPLLTSGYVLRWIVTAITPGAPPITQVTHTLIVTQT